MQTPYGFGKGAVGKGPSAPMGRGQPPLAGKGTLSGKAMQQQIYSWWTPGPARPLTPVPARPPARPGVATYMRPYPPPRTAAPARGFASPPVAKPAPASYYSAGSRGTYFTAAYASQPATSNLPIPYTKNHEILIIGDGDFSFAKALVTRIGTGEGIAATNLDTKLSILQKYQGGNENITWLQVCPQPTAQRPKRSEGTAPKQPANSAKVVTAILGASACQMFADSCRHLPGLVLTSAGLCDVYACRS